MRKHVLALAFFAAAIAATSGETATFAQLPEPSVVYLILGGPDASALYHRDTCPLIQKGGVTSSMELDDAKKRYFRPPCACIAGKEVEPPCVQTTTQIPSTTPIVDTSKYVGMSTKEAIRLLGVATTIIKDLWHFERAGITLRIADNKVIEDGAGSSSASNAIAPSTPVLAPTTPSGATAQCRDGSYSYSKSRSGTCSEASRAGSQDD